MIIYNVAKILSLLSVTRVVAVSCPVVATVSIMVATYIELLEADGVRYTSSRAPKQLALVIVCVALALIAIGL